MKCKNGIIECSGLSKNTVIKDTEINMCEVLSSLMNEHIFKYDIKSGIMTFLISENGSLCHEINVPDFLNTLKDDSFSSCDKETFIRIFNRECRILAKNSIEIQSSYFLGNGQNCWYRVEYKTTCDENGVIRYLSGRIINIDEDKRFIQHLKENIGMDRITKMYNYDYFFQKINEMIKNEHVEEGTLIVLGIANIRSIEIEFGFDYADAIIRRLARTIRQWYKDRFIFGYDKEKFLLFAPMRISDEIFNADCNGLNGFARNFSLDDSLMQINTIIGKAFYPENGEDIRNVIFNATSNMYNDNNIKENDLPIIPNNKVEINAEEQPKNELVKLNREYNSVVDKLFDFTELLFFNFKTYDISQAAFSIVSDLLDVYRIIMYINNSGKKDNKVVLYDSGVKIDDTFVYEEESMHSIFGDIAVYRFYRSKKSPELTLQQKKILGYLLKTIHTYLNRYISMNKTKFAKNHDMLFGCLNMNGFNEKMRKLQNEGFDFSKYSVMFINVKKYKNINAKVGFENGNNVIHTIIDYFQKVTTNDELFARAGGDNFTALLRNETVDERIKELNSLKCEIFHNDKKYIFDISFKMGIYQIESNMNDIFEIMENSSIAFTFARHSEKEDVVFFTNEKRGEFEYRKLLESSLRPALDNGEFLVYFQPKVDLDSYELVGAEALSRWFRDGAIMPPNLFIPIFEQNGLISEIDFHVFESVCMTISNWIKDGLKPVIVSVNFSKVSLETPDFADKIFNIANTYKTPTSYLEVEFTETCCMENEKKFNKILEQLKNYGFHVSLDDFGKGYSSINMLKKMNFDVLKLDRCFLVDETVGEERAKIILTSIINMAHSLNIEVISEGVETIEQIGYLKGLNCKKAQGFYFNKPLPRDQFEIRLAQGNYVEKFV